MEKRHVFQLALVAAGAGWALRVAYENWMEERRVEDVIENELIGRIINGRRADVTFDDFPYHLPEQLKEVLTSAAYANFIKESFTVYTRNLAPSSRTILLSGTSELYHQKLAKALAHFFDGKVLLLDIDEFYFKISKRIVSDKGNGKLSGVIQQLPIWKKIRLLSLSEKEKTQLFSLWKKTRGIIGWRSSSSSSWLFYEKLIVESLHKILVRTSAKNDVVLYIRDVDKLLYKSGMMYSLLEGMLRQRPGKLIILGSRILGSNSKSKQVEKRLSDIFPYQIEIRPQEEDDSLTHRKPQLEQEMELLQTQDNRNHIRKILVENDIVCPELDSIGVADTALLSDQIEEIVFLAVAQHLRKTKYPKFINGKLAISSESLSHGLNVFQQGK